MLRLTGRILLWLRSETVKLLLFVGVLLLLWGMVSPVGTLVWWLKQDIHSLGLRRSRPKPLPVNESDRSPVPASVNCYIVFLSGVGDFSANQLTAGEELFLKQLGDRHPNCVVVSDVFPYSAANEGLGGQRWLAPLWRFAEEAEGWLSTADVLIKIRNLWRFAISIDNRYGQVYNYGTAAAMIERMNAVHPIPRSPQQPLQVILIGTSGGAQVALGASTYLDRWLQADVTLVSIGGVFACDDSFTVVNHIYHLQGEKDWIEDINHVLFSSCWKWAAGSSFNRVRWQNRYTVQNTGPHAHDGDTGYFGLQTIGNSNTTYVELTIEQTNQLPIW